LMNLQTRADIMTLAPDSDDSPDAHPYAYSLGNSTSIYSRI
jgi:hypothetical protein